MKQRWDSNESYSFCLRDIYIGYYEKIKKRGIIMLTVLYWILSFLIAFVVVTLGVMYFVAIDMNLEEDEMIEEEL